ncbi:hypothetical protein [Marinomonas algicola]|uniref:hypothetical protein n=1 Tax=Marinomonas algicola TaxID=2773454 RepID=UPI00174CE104|nr:hypothetical protein [Marinomonas algicola]
MFKKIVTLKNILSGFIIFVFIQSLFFKFSDSFETQYIFGILANWSGLAWFGDYGGYLIGIAELIASALLLTRYNPFGALMAIGIMTGAIFFHLATPLGIVQPAFNHLGEVIGNDSAALFIMACFVWISAVILTIKDVTLPNSVIRSMLVRDLKP